MKRDLLTIGGASVGLGLIIWGALGNPEKPPVPRMHILQSLDADPNLKLVTERSTLMRTER